MDEETIRITGDRRAYAQALLAFAEPAPLTPLPVMQLIKPRQPATPNCAHRAGGSHVASPLDRRAGRQRFFSPPSSTGATARRLPIPVAIRRSPRRLRRRPPCKQAVQSRATASPSHARSREVRPQYTAAAMQQKIQGSVHVEMVVSTSGEPDRASSHAIPGHSIRAGPTPPCAPQRSGGSSPGRKDGKPVPVIVTLELTFTLK